MCVFDERERSLTLLYAMEARVNQAATLAWAVPGLALTGQALLFTVALDPNTEPGDRAIAAIAGLFTLLAAAHLFGKQVFNFDWYEAVIERERIRLGYDRLSRDHLLSDIESFPADTLLRKRGWMDKSGPPRRRFRNWLVVRVKAVWMWSLVLVGLAVLDVIVLVCALRERF